MKEIQQWQALIEKEIARTKFGKDPVSLYEPIRYLMVLGGKRLRPLLTLMGYHMYGSDTRSVVPYAVAVEAFHNFTLMHDDIMDNAPLRRGNKTVHEKWNINTAILSGDVMLVRVFEMLSTLEPKRLSEALRAFTACATAVCEGQQWDMDFEQRQVVTENEYIKMIRLKTAVLLGFSLELGAMLGGASAKERWLLREFGIAIGIGFQLKDDLLDAYADPKKFGKQVGGDIIANKKTYLLIKALSLASKIQKRELNYWLQARRFRKSEKVAAVLSIYDDLHIPRLAERKIVSYFDKGFGILEDLSKRRNTYLLSAFTSQLIDRQT